MTGPELATLSTIVWAVATTILFVELASWSAGGSWTIVPGIVRGTRSWLRRPQESDLPRLALSAAPGPQAVDPRPGDGSAPPLVSDRAAAWPATVDEALPELIELDHSEL